MKSFDIDDGRKLMEAAARVSAPVVSAVTALPTAAAIATAIDNTRSNAQPVSGTVTITPSGTQTVSGTVAVSGTVPVSLAALAHSTRSDTFTGTGNGVTVDRSALLAATRFGLQVKGTLTQFGITVWTVVLEGSLDGTNFTTLLSHVYPTAADGAVLFPVAGILTPCLYFRSRCTAITLGTATNIIATIVGMP